MSLDKRDILVEKIIKEYESYIEKLKQCSFDEIIENSKQISTMKLVKNYILNGYVAYGDEVEFLVELNNPLEAICSGFESSDEDIMDTLQEAIDEA